MIPSPRGIMIDIETQEYVELDYYENPQKTVQAEWVKTPIYLRSEPYSRYIGTSIPTYTLSVIIAASVDQQDQRTAEHVLADTQFIESLQYPDYGTGNSKVIKPPHLIRLYLTGVLDEIGYIESPTFDFLDTLDSFGRQLLVKVNFTFLVVSQDLIAKSYSQIRNRSLVLTHGYGV